MFHGAVEICRCSVRNTRPEPLGRLSFLDCIGKEVLSELLKLGYQPVGSLSFSHVLRACGLPHKLSESLDFLCWWHCWWHCCSGFQKTSNNCSIFQTEDEQLDSHSLSGHNVAVFNMIAAVFWLTIEKSSMLIPFPIHEFLSFLGLPIGWVNLCPV